MTEGSAPFHLTIENDIEVVGGAQQTFEEFLLSREVDPCAVYTVALAFEEIVTNVVKYSYDDLRRHQITIDADVGPAEILLRIADDGHEFNPLTAPPPDRTTPLEEREAGGLGIHIVRNLARRIEYRRLDGRNELTLFFPVTAET